MSSRLAELRRQRALLQENLAWLDREIAAAAGEVPAPAVAPKIERPPPFRPPAPAAKPAATAARTEADDLLAQFRAEEEKNRPPPTKAGCWMIFSALLVALIGGIGALVYFLYR